MRTDHRYFIDRMADLQLNKMIKEGRYVEYCKEVWLRHYGCEYPMQKDCTGKVKRYGE